MQGEFWIIKDDRQKANAATHKKRLTKLNVTCGFSHITRSITGNLWSAAE